MIRASLKHAIEKLQGSFEPLDAASFQEALDLLRENPDIELMFIDLVMPGLSEFEGLRTLRANYSDIPIAVISVHEDREHVLQAISEGVIGYIPKSAEGAELLRALTLVLNGDVYFPRDILQGGRLRGALPVEPPEQIKPRPTALTAREDQVLELVGRGRSNVDIAEELGLSPNTVRVHLRNVGLKLKLKERSELAAYKAAPPAAPRSAT
ncbi:DNA-binding response regulator [Hansschlegelia plantiphila]|uniref:DNA-binding response regulator n=2 Tax=Hansschlegelia plantiphila TaxID=374655 RepID=A0A9W6J4Y5_9HYPH|nr:DNA-binding response regulator [Hansschlegelia plantiphila]